MFKKLDYIITKEKMKVWELKKWDKVKHWKDWELLTFRKMSWMYWSWLTEDWEIQIGHTDNYEKWEDWIYIW